MVIKFFSFYVSASITQQKKTFQMSYFKYAYTNPKFLLVFVQTKLTELFVDVQRFLWKLFSGKTSIFSQLVLKLK